MKFTATQLSAPEGRRSFGWLDAVALMAILALLWSILHSSAGMVVRFDATQPLPISTDLRNIPYYAARTLLRMWIAFGFSLLFTFSVGYAAAKNQYRPLNHPSIHGCDAVDPGAELLDGVHDFFCDAFSGESVRT